MDRGYGNNFAFKFIMIGDAGVGKSSLIIRFTDKTFLDFYTATLGLDYKIIKIPIDNYLVELQIVTNIQWDTAGQERFKTLNRGYYSGSDVIMFVFDKNCQQSFENVDYWVEEANKYRTGRMGRVLIGNKSDLLEVVSKNQGEEKGRILNMEYMETSGKTGYQVDEIFMNLLRQAVKIRVENELQFTSIKKSLNTQNNNPNNSCF